MDSWDQETPSPDLKFEASPAESFLSMPGEMYPPLFAPSSPTQMVATMNPLEIMTPRSFTDDKRASDTAATGEDAPATPSPATEKRPTKKRKSWGQVLPEPKTCLPPRKRAKTEDEKEQRRVERVLRNRRAAQSSRERKRQEVEALEQRTKELEKQLENVQKTNMILFQELSKLRGSSGVVSRFTATLAPELFSSQDGHKSLAEEPNPSLKELMMTVQRETTINPTSLSPTLGPVSDAAVETSEASDGNVPASEPVRAGETSPDLTQHPAEVLCPDLQCQSAEASPAWKASQQPLFLALALYCQLALLLTSTSTLLSIFNRPLMQIAISLKANFSLPPTPALLNTIVWLVTHPSLSPPPTSTSTTSSSTRQPSLPAATSSTDSRRNQPSTTLRLKLLRKILACSPMLARPLTDATMAALRLVRSEETLQVDRAFVEDGSAARPRTNLPASEAGWSGMTPLPSREVLLTLLWAIKVEERRGLGSVRQAETTACPRPGRPRAPQSMAPVSFRKHNFVLRVERKRSWDKMDAKRRGEEMWWQVGSHRS